MSEEQKFIAKVLRDCCERAMRSPHGPTQLTVIAVVAGMFVYHFEQADIPIDADAFMAAIQPRKE